MANTSSNGPNNIRCPNIGGKLRNPRFLVIHFTASTNLQSTLQWLCNPKAKASAHVVIGRDGSVNALVPFDRVAWHAGASSWKTFNGLNNYSIGIELLNAGPLREAAPGEFRPIVGDQVITDVFEGKHKNNSVAYDHWQKYTDAQLQALDTLVGQLFTDFPTLVEIVGHDDIAPARKVDPGPAFADFIVQLKAKYDRYRNP